MNNDWQPIETAPKDDTSILLWCPKRAIHEVGGWNGNMWITHDKWHDRQDQPTHWMPLPEPPVLS